MPTTDQGRARGGPAEARASPAGEADPPAAARHRARPVADPARDRADREHQHLQRQVRVLPARRDASRARAIMSRRAVPEDRRRVRRAGHHARAHAQLRRGVPRSPAGREGALREGQGHQGSRHDQQRLADHREGRARHDRGRARRDQHQRRRRPAKRSSSRRASGSTTTRSSPTSSGWSGIRAELGKRRPEADPVVRPPEQLRRRAGLHRALARRSPTRSTSPTCTTGPGR